MTVSVYTKRCALLGLLLLLMSCGGGGTGGSGSPVVASGTVTGFGSVVVAGIRFDTADATITLNGQPGSEADLQLGHVVTVRGTMEPGGLLGTAETVVFASNAEGPIDRINPDTNSLVVLGQIVLIDATTQFGDTPFASLVVGNIVELSGFVDANGVLRATRVDRTQAAFIPGIEIETSGTVANLDNTTQTFTLNMLTVDFSQAQLIDLPGNQLRDGQVVDIASSQNVIAGVLFANRVQARDLGIQGEAGEEAEIEGIITRVLSADTFVVNSQTVRITPDTVFQGGTAADLTVQARLEVEGVFDTAGVLVAEEVEIGDAGLVELEGLITGVISADTFVVNEQTVRLTPDTVFDRGTVDDLVVGTQLQIEGFFDTAGVLVATGIEFFVDIEGPITAVVSADTFVVDAHTVRLTPDTVFEGGTVNDIAVNVNVEVEGIFDAAGVLVAISVEFL